MLKQKDTLPSPEHHTSRRNRYHLARPREGHSDMRGHVIRPLQRVHISLPLLGNHPLKKRNQILRSGGIRIFKDDQTGARVTHENGHDTLTHPRLPDRSGDMSRDVIQALSVRLHFEKCGLRFHLFILSDRPAFTAQKNIAPKLDSDLLIPPFGNAIGIARYYARLAQW